MPTIKPTSFRFARPLSRASTRLIRLPISRTPFIAPPSRSFTSTPIPQFSRSTKMAGPIVEITSAEEWTKNVENSKEPIVVDFFAEWCGPCKAIAPAVETFAKANEHVKFFKVDVDKLAEVAADNGISAMPTFLFFKNGEKLSELTVRGANPPAIKAAVDVVAAQ